MINKVQKPSNSECYTPSSEPFRIYSVTECGFVVLLEVIDRPTCLRDSGSRIEEFENFIVHISRIKEKASEMSQRNLSKKCERTIKNKTETKSKSPPHKKKKWGFTEQTSTTLEKSYRWRLHFSTARRLFFYSDPPPVCHPLPPSIIPLFFLSRAPTTLYNVRNTLGRKLLVGLFRLT
jgi:hypothetical protein